jgi:hypothetical protein
LHRARKKLRQWLESYVTSGARAMSFDRRG